MLLIWGKHPSPVCQYSHLLNWNLISLRREWRWEKCLGLCPSGFMCEFTTLPKEQIVLQYLGWKQIRRSTDRFRPWIDFDHASLPQNLGAIIYRTPWSSMPELLAGCYSNLPCGDPWLHIHYHAIPNCNPKYISNPLTFCQIYNSGLMESLMDQPKQSLVIANVKRFQFSRC